MTTALRDQPTSVAPDQVSQAIYALKTWVEDVLPDDFADIALPFEQRVSDYELSEKPVISIHIHGLRTDEDQPQRWNELAITLDGDLYIRQRLIDPNHRYRWLTYYYLWHLVVYLAGRLHRTMLANVDGNTITPNRINVLDVSPDTVEVQENEGAEGFMIQFELPLIISPQLELLDPRLFRRFFGEPGPDDPGYELFGGADTVTRERTDDGGQVGIGVGPNPTPTPVVPPLLDSDDPLAPYTGVQEVLRRSGR